MDADDFLSVLLGVCIGGIALGVAGRAAVKVAAFQTVNTRIGWWNLFEAQVAVELGGRHFKQYLCPQTESKGVKLKMTYRAEVG